MTYSQATRILRRIGGWRVEVHPLVTPCEEWVKRGWFLGKGLVESKGKREKPGDARAEGALLPQLASRARPFTRAVSCYRWPPQNAYSRRYTVGVSRKRPEAYFSSTRSFLHDPAVSTSARSSTGLCLALLQWFLKGFALLISCLPFIILSCILSY